MGLKSLLRKNSSFKKSKSKEGQSVLIDEKRPASDENNPLTPETAASESSFTNEWKEAEPAQPLPSQVEDTEQQQAQDEEQAEAKEQVNVNVLTVDAPPEQNVYSHPKQIIYSQAVWNGLDDKDDWFNDSVEEKKEESDLDSNDDDDDDNSASQAEINVECGVPKESVESADASSVNSEKSIKSEPLNEAAEHTYENFQNIIVSQPASQPAQVSANDPITQTPQTPQTPAKSQVIDDDEMLESSPSTQGSSPQDMTPNKSQVIDDDEMSESSASAQGSSPKKTNDDDSSLEDEDNNNKLVLQKEDEAKETEVLPDLRSKKEVVQDACVNAMCNMVDCLVFPCKEASEGCMG